MVENSVAARYLRLCREYEQKFGERIYNCIGIDGYTKAACDMIERCIQRGTPCNFTTDLGLSDCDGVAARYISLCRDYEKKFGRRIDTAIEIPRYTEAACNIIERCIRRGTPCNFTTDLGLTSEQAKEVMF